MGVTAEMLRPYLEGWTLKQIIEAKRLFSVDLKILEDLPTNEDRAVSGWNFKINSFYNSYYNITSFM